MLNARYPPHGAGTSRSRGAALAALGCMIAMWAVIPVVLKYLTAYLDAWTVMGVRYTIAALFWLPLLLGPQGRAAGRAGLWRASLLPAAVFLGGQTLWSVAPYYAAAGPIAFVSRATLLFSLLFGFALLPAERARFRSSLFRAGLALTFAGVLFMFGGHRSVGGGRLGLLLMLAATVFWGWYSVAVKQYLGAFSSRTAFAAVSLYCAPAFLAGLFAMGDWRQLGGLSALNWTILAASGVMSIAVGHALSYTAIKAFGPVVTEGASQSIPFFTLVLAWACLGESLAAAQWAGGIGIVCGSVALLATEFRRGRR